MLKRENRLTSDYDFKKVKRLGKSTAFPYFFVSYLKAGTRSETRFGFIIPNSFDKRATERNRVKRVIRENVMANLKVFPEGYDVVFIIRNYARGKDSKEISSEFNRFISKNPFSGDRSVVSWKEA